ncbi:MAG: hypothetical protein HON77_05775 [Gammaproteobacteria bacterium]|nr:hypothetical protein [Gammaproteobacteria bacterium]MBT5443199.1 hypothetical protein [Gammaproteobacteria bacterium]MBT6583799.1 hypothetical protein [Gammaproteobacteria bacterium]
MPTQPKRPAAAPLNWLLGGKRVTAASQISKILTAYYGLYQAVHILVNIRGTWILMSGSQLDFPAPPPPSGWPVEVIHFMIAIGVLDLMNAIASVFFVYAFFHRRPNAFWLGNLTLSISVYAFGLYTYWTYASNAWVAGNIWAYVFVSVTFIPILVLWCMYCYWGIRNELKFGKRA